MNLEVFSVIFCLTVSVLNVFSQKSSFSYHDFADFSGKLLNADLLLKVQSQFKNVNLSISSEFLSELEQYTEELLGNDNKDERGLRLVSKNQKSSIFSKNNTCLLNFLFFVQSLKYEHRWALQVVDSWGKLPSGVLLGNILWSGNYDECRNVSVVGNASVDVPFFHRNIPTEFDGQYCRAVFVNKSGIVGPIVGAKLKAGLNYGMCLPAGCDQQSLEHVIDYGLGFLNKTLGRLGLTFKELHCPKKATDLDAPAILGIIVLLFLFLLALLGTFVDYTSGVKDDANLHKNDDATEADEASPSGSDGSSGRTPLVTSSLKHLALLETAKNFLQCFSLIANKERLLSTTDKRLSRNNDWLPVLAGLRFLSLAWIILGHTFYFSFALVENPLDLLNPYGHTLFFQSIMQAVYSVDTFFVLSATLVAYNFFGFADKYPDEAVKVLFWIKFYASRILRILPTYALVLCVYVGLWKYVGYGPFWPDDGFEVNRCRSTWWTNVLFINNLVEIPYEDSPFGRQLCMGWSWYLSADMQLFILSPLILIPLFKSRQRTFWKYVGFGNALALGLIGMLVTGVLVSVKDLPPNLFPPNMKLIPKAVQLQFDVYFKPFPHCCCYALGLLLGFYLQRLPNRPKRLSKAFVAFGWIVVTTLILMVIYGLWPEYRGYVYSGHVSALYHSTSRLVWGITICWLIFVCAHGDGGLVNRFLSWKLFLPLSRLTFCAYLIHPMLMYAYYFTLRSPLFYTDFTMVWLFGSFLLFTFMAAFFVSIFFEAPFLAIRKRIIG